MKIRWLFRKYIFPWLLTLTALVFCPQVVFCQCNGYIVASLKPNSDSCAPDTFLINVSGLTPTSGYTYEFNFGSGAAPSDSTLSSAQLLSGLPLTVVYDSFGYGPLPVTIELTINPCSTPVIDTTININSRPQATLVNDDNFQDCVDDTIQAFTHTSTTTLAGNFETFHIDFLDQNITDYGPPAPAPFNHSVNFHRSGSYPLTYTVRDDLGCTSSFKDTMNIGLKIPFSSLKQIPDPRPYTCDSNEFCIEIDKYLGFPPGAIIMVDWDYPNLLLDSFPIPALSTTEPDTVCHVYKDPACNPGYEVRVWVDLFGCPSSPPTAYPDLPVYLSPIALFTVDPVDPNDCYTRCFTNLSTAGLNSSCCSNCDQFYWDYGHGPPELNPPFPCHTYANSGTYDVTLRVASSTCGDSIHTETICVDDPPTVDFDIDTVNGTTCPGSKFLITNNSTLPSTNVCSTLPHLWCIDPSPGWTAPINCSIPGPKDFEVTFTQPGDFTICLDESDACIVTPLCKIITIHDKPTVTIDSISGGCSQYCFIPTADIFDWGSDLISAVWTVTDPLSTALPPYPVPILTPPYSPASQICLSVTGNYTIRLDAANSCGTGFDSKTFTVSQLPAFTPTPQSATVCPGTDVEININPGATATFFEWSVLSPFMINCNSPCTSTTSTCTGPCTSVTVTPNDDPIIVTVTGYYGTSAVGCSTVKNVQIDITQVQQPSICMPADICGDGAPIPLALCVGSQPSGTWSGPGVDVVRGVFDPTLRPPVICNVSNIITYTVAAGGCNASATASINVHCPVADITPALASICSGQRVNLCASAGSSYLWSTFETTQCIDVLTAGTYIVTVTDAFGCTASASRDVSVHSLPQPSILPANPTICKGDNITLDETGCPLCSYAWSTGPTTPSITVSPASTATYEVIVTDGNGCSASTTTDVNVNPKPALTLTADKDSFCRGYGPATIEAIYNNNDPTLILNWHANACPAPSCGGSVIVNPAITTEYFATVTNSFSCSISDSITITVNDTPVAGMIFSADTCVNQVVHFRDNSSLPGTYSWNFGDITISTLEHPTHTYTASGNYTITHTVTTGPGCSDDNVYQYLHVKDPPVANFRLDTDSGCGPLTVIFKDTSTGPDLVFDWTFLNLKTGGVVFDSTDSSTGIYSFSFTFPAVQGDTIQYEIILTVTNPCGIDVKKDTVTVFSKPVACFAINPIIGCDSLKVDFINCSSDTNNTFTWTASAVDSAVTKNLSLNWRLDSDTFWSLFPSDTTIWNIKLTDSNGCGSDDSIQQVKVLPPTVTAFFSIRGQTEICQFTEIEVCDGSTGASSIDYDWGDSSGSTSAIGACLTHPYTDIGVFDICQNAKGCGYSRYCRSITVLPAPRVSFTVDSPLCANNPVQFTNTSIDDVIISPYLWDFDNGNGPTSGDKHPSHTYTASGDYEVLLTGESRTTQCKGYDTMEIFIHPLPSVLFAPKDTSGCEPLALAFSLTQPDSRNVLYHWTFTPEVGLPVDTLALTTVYYTFSADTYNIKLKAVSVEGCTDSAYTGLRVYPKPESIIGIVNRDTCDVPLTVDFVNRSSGGIRDVLWEPSELDSVWNKDTLTVTYIEEGYDTISLIVLNDYRCSDTSDYPFHAIDIPEVSFSFNPATGCETLCVNFHLDSNHATSYLWHFGDLTTGTDQNPQHCYSAGQYTVRVELTYENGICFDTIEIPNAVLVHPTPVADFYFEENTTPVYDGTYVFNNTSAHSDSFTWDYDWHDGDYPDAAGITDTVTTYRYYENREFIVRLISSNEFCADTVIATLLPDFLGGLFVPNAFTPESGPDEVREFTPVGVGLAEYEIEIYSPAGTLLWESNLLDAGRPAEGWNGNYKGKPMQQDAYVWKVRAIFEDGRVWAGMPNKDGKLYRIGTVTLIR